MAGHCQPTPLPETPRHTGASMARSLVGSLLLSLWSWCTQGFVCALQESLFPQFCGSSVIKSFKVRFPGVTQYICQIPRLGSLLGLELLQQRENFFGMTVFQFVSRLAGSSIAELMATFSKRTYATHCAFQDCFCQNLCPRGRPLLTHASAEDPQTLKGRSGSVSGGGHCTFPWVLVSMRFCLYPLSISSSYEI